MHNVDGLEGRMLVAGDHYRGFDPDLDSRPVMHSQYLRPEEEVLFAYGTSTSNAAYDVRGRQRNGRPGRSVAGRLGVWL